MIKIAICDDEEIMLGVLKQKISKIFAEHNRPVNIEIFTEPNELLMSSKKSFYSIVFLDVNMPNINGLQTAEQLHKICIDTKIVFITSLNDIVYDVFQYKPIAFIRKDRFEIDLKNNLKFILNELEADEMFYPVYVNNIVQKINLTDIYYFESIKNNVYIHLKTSMSPIIMRQTLKLVKSQLDNLKTNQIIQIHKSFLVNVKYINKINNREIELDNGVVLQIGRNYYTNAKDRFLTYTRNSL